jgi:outer membrane protein OmpA-like peptidoglycan-associated protein
MKDRRITMLKCSSLLRLVIATPLVAAATLAGGAAIAQDYTAEDIIEHFATVTPVGPEKGLTVGAAVAPAPFDLRVTFPLDSAELLPAAQANLDAFAAALQDTRLSKYSVFVDGHTDEVGSDDYNLDLSGRRANAVVAYLVRSGVEIERLTPRGFGETRPLDADGTSPENRRVETSLAPRVE